MYTYDFIVGIKMGQYHSRILNYNREELDTQAPEEVYDKLAKMVSDCMASTLEVPNRDEINRVLNLISTTLSAPNIGEAELTIVDNCFDTIAYLGIEADAFRRDDGVVPATEQQAVMAFVINTKIEDTDERIAPALSFFTNDTHMGSISDIVMETLRSIIRLDSTLSDVIRLNSQIDNWEMLSSVGASNEFDATRLHTLLNDMGFKIKVFLS